MSALQINHSNDLKRLRDEGYHLEISDGHLFVHHIPYVNSKCDIKFGVLVTTLNISGNSTAKPNTHVMMFSGEDPCDKGGVIISGIKHSNINKTFTNGIIVTRQFSNKPKEGYSDYYEKVRNYSNIISAPAKYLDDSISEMPFLPVINIDESSVFNYYDTNGSRANIEQINRKLSEQKIAIIGMGGTGAYILDLIAKTHVAEIHIYDGDIFLNHNAFRSPGAASIDILNKRPNKAIYYKGIYEAMRKNIYEHSYYLFFENFVELDNMDYVFICIDDNEVRAQLVRYLIEKQISFIDVGLGVNTVDDKLIGTIRVTTVTEDKNDHVDRRIPQTNNLNNEYETNIQIAELNNLNAVYAVMKWKKLSNFYQDLENECHSTYSINNSFLNNEETRA